MRIIARCGLVGLMMASSAHAAPGLGEKVYGSTVEAGVTEVEARYGQLTGGSDDGEDALVLEVSHGFSDRFYGAVLTEFEREPRAERKLEALAVEGIFALGKFKPLDLDVALYGEYGIGLHDSDKVETKLLLEHDRGPFDGRLNLIAEKVLDGSSPVGLGYAASADWEVADELRLGGAAFGDLGSTQRLTTQTEHFAGPIAKYEVEHLGQGELGIEAGYLLAIGRARDDAKGQVRLLLEYEMKF
ncbi:MAG: hypothetical protein ABIW03_02185 [Sphingomicrobium sp.]